jgi:SAM-dependent methyltransferase
MKADESPTPQDRILYPGRAWQYSHPDRLATNAWLHGLDPPPVGGCRVLELGCGAGQNLIPMAYGLPGARFVGVELGARPVEYGMGVISRLGLANVELRHLDIRSVTPELGEFDYIIAHGVYTWVAPKVRESVLRIFAENLAPSGVAYLNYNALPGGYIRAIVRDMMRQRLRHFDDPVSRIPEAIRIVRKLVECQPEGSPYGALLRDELARLEENSPDVIYHNDLAQHNDSVYLSEVLEAASRHGLQYLCEARLADAEISKLPVWIQDALSNFSVDKAEREQYFDFLVCSKYRRTLLCRDGIEVAPTLDPERLRTVRIASSARPGSDDADVHGVVAALNEIWPQSIGLEDLLREVLGRLGVRREPAPEETQIFVSYLVSGYATGFIDLHMWEPQLVRAPGEAPRVSAVARLESETQDWVTGLRHNSVHMDDPVSARLLPLLDGTRDRRALMAEADGAPLSPEQLESILKRFGEFCLLEA